MIESHQPYIRAIVESPLDDLPRLIYCDFLEEQDPTEVQENFLGYAEAPAWVYPHHYANYIRQQLATRKRYAHAESSPVLRHIMGRWDEEQLITFRCMIISPAILGVFQVTQRGFVSELYGSYGNIRNLAEQTNYFLEQPIRAIELNDLYADAGDTLLNYARSLAKLPPLDRRSNVPQHNDGGR
jgi:uncharacterized protein (TIGR02996 family)